MGHFRFLIMLAIAIALGVMATFAFAPYGIWPLAIVAISGLQLLMKSDEKKRWARLCFSFGLGYFGLGLAWIGVSLQQFGGLTLPATVGMLALLTVYLSSFMFATGYLMRRLPIGNGFGAWLLVFPALWLISDWARGWLFTGFPWLWLGYSQVESPFAGYAPLLGVQGVTLLMLTVAGALALYTQKKERSLTILLVLMLLGLGMILRGYSWVDSGSSVKVAVVQANIAQDDKWRQEKRWSSLQTFIELTKPHLSSELIIWPESAIPAFEYEMLDFITQLDTLTQRAGSSLITGVVSYNQSTNEFYNTVIGIGETGDSKQNGYNLNSKNHYFKHHLLPLGEYVPFKEYVKEYAPLFNLPMSNFTEGNAVQRNLLVNGYKVAPAICYEILFSEQMRQNLTKNSAAIITVSNDAWFGHSNGPYQHLQIAQMRALEFARPVIRSTNTGVSAVINNKGLIGDKLDIGIRGVISSSIKPAKGQTPYHKWGSLPLILWCGFAIFATVYIRKGEAKKKKERLKNKKINSKPVLTNRAALNQ